MILCGERQEDFAKLNNLNSTQGQLADYNLLVDKLNTDTDRADVELECRDLKLDNDGLTQEVEQLWADKRAKEAQIAQLELELEQARTKPLLLVIT